MERGVYLPYSSKLKAAFMGESRQEPQTAGHITSTVKRTAKCQRIPVHLLVRLCWTFFLFSYSSGASAEGMELPEVGWVFPHQLFSLRHSSTSQSHVIGFLLRVFPQVSLGCGVKVKKLTIVAWRKKMSQWNLLFCTRSLCWVKKKLASCKTDSCAASSNTEAQIPPGRQLPLPEF